MDKIVLFISEYSEENYLLARQLCFHQKQSCAFFHGCDESDFRGSDYSNTISRSEDTFPKRSFVATHSKADEDLAVELYSFIQDLSVQPDLIVCKGDVSGMLALSSIKEFSGLDIPLFSILENVKPEYSEEELRALKAFDSILLMDDLESNIELLSPKVLFPGFITSGVKNRKDHNPLLNIPVINEPIVFTNNENYHQVCKEVDAIGLPINVCSYRSMSEMDISLMIMLSSQVFDLTGDEFFPLIVSKMGKKLSDGKVLAVDNQKNLGEKEDYGFDLEDCFKDFSEHIEKEIYHDLKNHLKEPIVIKANTVAM